jgi:hypothetical protein
MTGGDTYLWRVALEAISSRHHISVAALMHVIALLHRPILNLSISSETVKNHFIHG